MWLFYLDCYQNRCSSFCSSIPPLPAIHPPALLARSKRVCFKIWVCRKYLFFFLFFFFFFLCNSPRSSHVSGFLLAESLCFGTLGHFKTHCGSRGRSDKRWEEQLETQHDRKKKKKSRCFQKHKTITQTNTHRDAGSDRTHLCHLFTCYAGRSRLCVLWASLWQRVVGQHFPEGEAANIKPMTAF